MRRNGAGGPIAAFRAGAYSRRVENFVFTQCVAVLFERVPALEIVQRALDEWRVVAEPNQGEGDYGWAVCGPGFVVELRSGGFAVVDVVGRAWPDDPAEAQANSALGAAWRAAAFGPVSVPGALARAIDQSWAWSGGASAASRHSGFVRLRTGATSGDAAPSQKRGFDHVYELATLTELARPLLRLDGALAFFAPGGEALRSESQVEAALERKVGDLPPLELWSNVRSVALPQQGGVQWLLLDVIGMHQFGLPDLEAVFAEGAEKPDAVEGLLRSACVHQLSAPIAPGSTADDSGNRRWRAVAAGGIVSPPRPVLRWLPEGSDQPPREVLASLASRPTAGTG